MASLYLHLPFCTRRCDYCAFYSEPSEVWRGCEKSFVDRMESEILRVKERYESFDTLFLGGGNPLNLSVDSLMRLISAAGEVKECTVEMNPYSLNESHEVLFENKLVNRISMGIQSLSDSSLKVLGRASSEKLNRQGIARALEYRVRYNLEVNFDMITAIPGSSIASSLEDLAQLVETGEFDHLSLYALTFEEGTVLSRTRQPVEENRQADTLFACWDYLKKRGFSHYEVSNFAKEKRECLHNLNYWRLGDYIGLGPSAASRFHKDGKFFEASCEPSLERYISTGPFTGYHSNPLTATEELEEYLITGLRTAEGIDKKVFSNRFSRPFDSLFLNRISRLDKNLYRNDNTRFSLTKEGMMVLDSVLRALFC